MARIIRSALALGAGLVALAGATTTAHAQGRAAAPAAAAGDTVVQIEAGDSNRCLAIPSDPNVKNGGRAHLDFCVDWAWTKWRVVPVDNSSVELRSVKDGRCLEVENSGTQVKAVVQSWDCSGGKQMRWQMDLVDPVRQLYQLRPTHVQDRCLDVPDEDVVEGKPLWQWYCNQSSAQLWRIKPVAEKAS
ncbi:RICIN domain-containing protein [Streptomyces sp. AV19]|uniref:RICIN domain-containing protein n=1 Tax=Streptomyces sp. AV19 TaxID=2793068 RepID=UPI0018FEAB13|nr:RICIN domain-containing protein [Streptomyces sp. AV19]MBH1933072.1 RICIN domain-containing protein [Streptomyces sp. AV19]MDG4531784.1 RICIN domain-containing protein [Streptomyces sp. AV19]